MARVLVMDQDVSIWHLLHDVLEEGYQVIEAHNGYEGMPRDAAEPATAGVAAIRYLIAFSACVRHKRSIE